MPAIITHEFFGRDVYDKLFQLIGGSKDEADAFLLGNQGPDPLFYSVVSPRLAAHRALGAAMHDEQTSQLIFALKQAIYKLPTAHRHIGRAYALGFLCHYTLDSTMHPFVFAQQYQLCDAGVEGLTRNDGSEVHALIESELDELVLFKKTQQTIEDFNPSANILHASNHVLNVISSMYDEIAWSAYGEALPPHMFATCVRNFRLVQRAFYSPSGIKRALLGNLEELVRPYSFFRAMSHRSINRESSIFDNQNRSTWTCPFTGETSAASFWDLYQLALSRAQQNIVEFDMPHFDEESSRELTGELNFSGKPVAAFITSVESTGAKA